jgi:hypothetical protein
MCAFIGGSSSTFMSANWLFIYSLLGDSDPILPLLQITILVRKRKDYRLACACAARLTLRRKLIKNVIRRLPDLINTRGLHRQLERLDWKELANLRDSTCLRLAIVLVS